MVRIYSTHFNSDNFKDNSRITPSAGNNPIFNFKTTPPVDDFGGEEDNPNSTLDRYNSVDPNWRTTYAEYTPTDQAKYNKVHKYVADYAKKKGNTTADVNAITNMVCKLSDDYGIDPEITAVILARETGGFVFTPKVMSGRKSYKGVAQVDFTTIEVLYNERPYIWNSNNYPSAHAKAVAFEHEHYGTKDIERINELKKIYPTEQDLWQAIQTDVSLGLEIGIMAFKVKLNATKGRTEPALARYCANQYQLPADSTAQRTYSKIPEYHNTTPEIVDEKLDDIEPEIISEEDNYILSQETIKQILLDSMELKSYMDDEEKELYNYYANTIKYTEDGNIDINDADTVRAILYFEALIQDYNKLAEEDSEEFDF